MLLEETANTTRTCKLLGISRQTAYNARKNDPEFANDWAESIDIGYDTLEAEAVRRAFQGVEKPVYYQGKQCGFVTEYSDTLLIFLLKGGRPEKYAGRHRFETAIPVTREKMAIEELDKRIAEMLGTSADTAKED